MIPENLGSSYMLLVLDLQQNNLHGSIPQTLGNGGGLNILNLNGNQLEGPLPSSLVNCSHLQVLDVGKNKINDTFPQRLMALSELQVIILRSNRFHGSSSSSSTRFPFTHLRILDLSHDEFSRVLPTIYFRKFEAMMQGDRNSVIGLEYIEENYGGKYYSTLLTVKGNNIEMDRTQTTFVIIDLSSSHFQGGIPKVSGKRNLLKVLNFSHNNFTRPIPPSLENLKALESLDLSSNKLVGEIPWQLTSLNYLQVLNLSYNQLVGTIPREYHFDTFPNDSYIGNPGLCGFPLSKECVTDGTSKSFRTIEDDSVFENGFGWKSVLTGYGCGMVFGLLMEYVTISTGKPPLLAKFAEGLYGRKLGMQNNKLRTGRNVLLNSTS